MKYAFFLLAFAILLSGCSDPADKVPAAEVTTPKAAEPKPVNTGRAPTGKLYPISRESTIGFIGSKVTGSHEGGFRKITGLFSTADGELTDEHFIKIDTRSIWADNETLTAHLMTDEFFDVAQFPTATFKSKEIEKEGAAHAITGDLTLHGITKEIRFPASILVSDKEVRVTAEFSINRFDFGLAYEGKKDDLIYKDVVIKLNIVANAKSG